MTTPRWTVGNAIITSVLEAETLHIPPELFFPDATAAQIAEHGWLVPDFADEHGNIGLRVHAIVIETNGRCVLVDPCVGNDKARELPFWSNQSWPFLARFAEAGFTLDQIDTVVHTHLHADHVGWDTHLDGDRWVPTFTSARHLYTAAELDHRRTTDIPGVEEVYNDSIAPIFAAGLADIVNEDADLGDGLRLEPTPGHTPGHVSLWVESDGERALVTGDFLHHPVQCARPDWHEIADHDIEQARATRRRFLTQAADTGALIINAHFPTHPAGHIVTDGDTWRFVPA
jgi:glyoxylase-like metal-dependent hydrolase (beta-lactamase superfamily II)